MTEDKMIGKYHQLNGHEFEQTLGDGEGQRSLVCCSPWGCKESDTTEQLNNNLPHQRVHCAHLFPRRPLPAPRIYLEAKGKTIGLLEDKIDKYS